MLFRRAIGLFDMAVVTGILDFAERDDDLAALFALGLACGTALESGDVARTFANLQGGGRLGTGVEGKQEGVCVAAPTTVAKMVFFISLLARLIIQSGAPQAGRQITEPVSVGRETTSLRT